MQQEGIAARAAFIGERLVASLLSEGVEIRQNSGKRSSWANQRESAEGILLSAYCQCMGKAWDDKVNLYAFRRLLAECGWERPPASADLLTRGACLASTPTSIGKEEIAVDFDRFVDGQTDAYQSLSKIVASLCDAITAAHDCATLRSAESAIRQHANTLRRKRSQLLLKDDYGAIDETRWRKEISHFVTSVVLPAIEKGEVGEPMFAAIAERVQQVVAEAGPERVGRPGETPVQITPEEFEAHCAELLQGQGWKTRLTKRSGDQGVDIVAERGGITMVVQCKKYSTPVGNGAVQEVHSGSAFYGADLGIVVSNVEFTVSARELAKVLGVLLMHYSELEEFDRILLGMWRKHEK